MDPFVTIYLKLKIIFTAYLKNINKISKNTNKITI